MKNKPMPKNLAIICLIFSIIFLVFSIGFLTNFVKAVEHYVFEQSCNFQEETATIVRYDINYYTSHGTQYFNFVTYYEYIDENGKIYSGVAETRFQNESEAQAEIGKTMTIYVDHEKGVHKSSAGTNIGAVCFNGIIGFIALPLFIFTFICLVRHLIIVYKEKTKNQEDEG